MHWGELVDAGSRDAATSAMRTFFFDLASILRTDWQVRVQQAIPVYDAATSMLVREDSASTAPLPVNGLVATTVAWVGGAGAVVKWNTGTIWQGRHRTGRTFIVPTAGGHDTDGTLNPTAVNAINTAAPKLIAAAGADFSIWSKKYDRTGPKPVQTSGSVASVMSYTLLDRAATLRSRRS
jgi:hypothetical protein